MSQVRVVDRVDDGCGYVFRSGSSPFASGNWLSPALRMLLAMLAAKARIRAGMSQYGSLLSMFERNKVDNAPEQTAVAIEAVLDDGRVLKGKVAIPQHKSVCDVLNGQGAFLEFEPFDGERQFIAKATLRTVKMLAVGRGPNLALRLRDLDGFEPHSILGLTRAATWDEVKSAYHRLAKIYHPDRYSAAELPPEVRDYLASMARRVNAAYAALEVPQQIMKQSVAGRSAPIYITPARA